MFWNYTLINRQPLISSTIVIFTVKFLYLQIPPLLPLLANSITCIFHPCYCYCQIPLLSNSTPLSKLYFTFKFQYLQIPKQLIYSQIPVLANSITCKFIQPQDTPILTTITRSFAITKRTARRSCLVDLLHCQHCFLRHMG